MIRAILKQRLELITVLIGVVLLFSSGCRLPIIDHQAEHYFNTSIKKASIAFGVARLLNAGVSSIQESEIQVEPGGIGVSIAAGQMFDPLNDLTERVSDVMVTAIVTLGVQKIAYEISAAIFPPLIGGMLIFAALMHLALQGKSLVIIQRLLQIIVIAIAARFSLPLAALVSIQADQHYFSTRFEHVNQTLSVLTPDAGVAVSTDLPTFDGSWDGLAGAFESMKTRAKNVTIAFDSLTSKMGDIVQNLLELMWLQVAHFALNILILPLASFLTLREVMILLFGWRLPKLIRLPVTESKTDSSGDGDRLQQADRRSLSQL